MNATVRFGMIASVLIGGFILAFVTFGRPTNFTSWLAMAVLAAMLVLSFVRWRQMVRKPH